MSKLSSTSPINSPIFIVAARRSGTSLLKTILDQHSALIAHPDEPQFILELYEIYGLQITDIHAAAKFMANHPFRIKTVSATAVQEAYNNYEHLSLAEFVDIYLQLWGKSENKRPVLKHPRFIFQLDVLQTIFQNVKVIHIVRDPRANVASQISRWPNLSIWECTMFWKTAVTAARQWAKYRPNQYIEVRYVDLLQKPEKTIETLCRQLDLSYEQQILTFHEETRYFSPAFKPERVVLTAVDISRITVWQKRLSSIEIKLIESCCHQEMSWWHYPLINPSVSFFPYTARYLWEHFIFTAKNIIRAVKKAICKSKWHSNPSTT